MEKSLDSAEIRLRCEQVMENIERAAKQSGRDPGEITAMIVTKTRPLETIQACVDYGFTVFGENRPQEVRDKLAFFDERGLALHLIGSLQSNKVKYVAGKVASIDSVDSFETAQLIAARASAAGVVQNIMVEVNLGDPNKHGVAPNAVEPLLRELASLESVKVTGLMTIPPIVDEQQTDRLFGDMRNLFIDIKNKKIDNVAMDFLSMGMSGDYEIAIRNGANLLRIGTAVFG